MCGASLQPSEACATLPHAVSVAQRQGADVVALAPAERFELLANVSMFLTRNLTLTTAAWPAVPAVLSFATTSTGLSNATFVVSNSTTFVMSNVDVRDTLLVPFVSFEPLASVRLSLRNVLFDCVYAADGAIIQTKSVIGIGDQRIELDDVRFNVRVQTLKPTWQLMSVDAGTLDLAANNVSVVVQSNRETTIQLAVDGPASVAFTSVVFDGVGVAFEHNHPDSNLSVVDCAFRNTRTSAVTDRFADFVQLRVHSSKRFTSSVLVRNTTFVDISAGAIAVSANSDAISHLQVNIETSEFRNVSSRAQFGSVSAFVSENQELFQLDISDCSFSDISTDNLIGKGGVLLVDSRAPDSSVTITDSHFSEVYAADGLAVWASHLRHATLSNCTFVNRHVKRSAGVDGSILVIVADNLVINGSTIHGAPRLMSAAGYASSTLSNLTMWCMPGLRALALQNAFDDASFDTIKTDVWCERCPSGAYNLSPQKIRITNNTPDTTESIGCHPCPAGSQLTNCSGMHVGAAKDFWAFVPPDLNETTELAFVECPPHTCCAHDPGCDAPNECEHHRAGVLCGACEPGFTHSLSGCAEESVCTPARVWIGNGVVMLVCFLIALHKSKKPKTREADGSFAIAVSFVGKAQIVLSECVLTARTSVAGHTTAFKEFIGSVLAAVSGVILPQSFNMTLCPLERMSSLDRLLVTALFPACIFVSWALIAAVLFVVDRRRRRKHRDSELLGNLEGDNDAEEDSADATAGVPATVRSEPADEHANSLGYRLAVSALMLYDFSLFSLLNTALSLLSTIDVPGVGCRLWKAGDVECSALIQGGAAVAFVAVLTLPAVFALIQRRWPHSVFGAAVALVHQSPLRQATSWYNIVLIGRRAVMAAAFALFQDKDVRAISVRSILVVSFALHVQLLPYATTTANRLETISLLCLVLVSSLQQMLSSFEAVAIIQSCLLVLTFAALFGTLAWRKLQPRIAAWRSRHRRSKTQQN
jgi:hypothetical protein